MSHLSQLRAILHCSNNSSLFEILVHDTQISNGFIYFRWRSNTFLSLHFCKPVWILNMCKIQKTFSLPSSARVGIVFLQLQNKNHWFIVWASIYNCNFDKANFSKLSRHGMINVREDKLEPSYFLHCIYICVKMLMYSKSISNLSI